MRRTKKEFENYNDYQDRPFGLKWGTAFSLSELTQVIEKARHVALKEVVPLPVMTVEEIDEILQLAFKKNKKVSIQLHLTDDYGNLYESIEGRFEGKYDHERVYIEGIAIPWELIRNIEIVD